MYCIVIRTGEQFLFSISAKNLTVFGFFMPFWWEWQLALYKLSDFPGIKNINGLNDLNSLNNLSGLNDFYSLMSLKTL